MGEVGVKMRHRSTPQFLGQVPCLEKASENDSPTKAQRVQKGRTVTAGLPAQEAQIGLQGSLPVSVEREIGHRRSDLRNPRMDRLSVGVLGRKNTQGNSRPFDADDLIEDKRRRQPRPGAHDVSDRRTRSRYCRQMLPRYVSNHFSPTTQREVTPIAELRSAALSGWASSSEAAGRATRIGRA